MRILDAPLTSNGTRSLSHMIFGLGSPLARQDISAALPISTDFICGPSPITGKPAGNWVMTLSRADASTGDAMPLSAVHVTVPLVSVGCIGEIFNVLNPLPRSDSTMYLQIDQWYYAFIQIEYNGKWCSWLHRMRNGWTPKNTGKIQLLLLVIL